MRSAVKLDIGLTDYGRAHALQQTIVDLKIRQPDTPDHLVCVEHSPVFTLGKRGGRENLIVSSAFLKKRQIQVVQTGRGGNITYHGPGQAVFYPIVDLERQRIGIKDFVYGLEQVVIDTVNGFGVQSVRNPKNHGVWVSNSKIASIGISIRHGVSFHGIAVNACMDMTPFSWINPCGMTDVSMTSLEKELKESTATGNVSVDMASLFTRLLNHFTAYFDFTIEENHEYDQAKLKACLA